MPKPLDLTGQQFGRLTAISRAKSRSGHTYWLCQCQCGNTKEIQTRHLIDGLTRSCGCLRPKKSTIPLTKSDYVSNARRRIKTALVEAFGHKCAACGVVDIPAIYDFHHLCPSTKSFGLSAARTTRSRQAYLDEAKKCVMLCANCHRKIEAHFISADDLEKIPIDEQTYWRVIQEMCDNPDAYKMAR